MQFHKFESAERGTIFIPNEIDPQEYAMMAAWFSRSTLTVEQMVDKVTVDGTAKFMEQFYVGYGHESIGDLVDVKMFIHDIPLYLAPLIEHYALFRGQESSTRYIDFSKQRLHGPNQSLMKQQIDEYLKALKLVTNNLIEYNKPDSENQVRAVKARAFDICRGLIPMGAVTNVAWFGDIRSIKGHLAWMLQEHPWSEPWVTHIYEALKAVYPASMEKHYTNIRVREPWVFDYAETEVMFDGSIDFGSWRDMNRHRVGRHLFHLPKPESKLNEWYEMMLSMAGFKLDRELLFHRGEDDRGTLLLGQDVYFCYEMPKSQLEYFVWRRSQMDVHPTLRLKVAKLGVRFNLLEEVAPDVGLGFIERRGASTILHKGGVAN